MHPWCHRGLASTGASSIPVSILLLFLQRACLFQDFILVPYTPGYLPARAPHAEQSAAPQRGREVAADPPGSRAIDLGESRAVF